MSELGFIKIDVACKVCGAPGRVEFNPAMQQMEGWLKLYACDSCMSRRNRGSTPRPKQTKPQCRLPHPND